MYKIISGKKTLKELAIFLGIALEYYDYIIYTLLIAYVSQIFFPESLPQVAIIKSFGVVVAGNFSRMIGSFSLGYLCDKLGLKYGLSYSIILMGFISILIGLIPTKGGWIEYSAWFLVLLRFLQGLAYSVEIPSSISYIAQMKNVENSDSISTNKNALFGFLFSCTSFGYIVAGFMMYLLTANYSESEILDYAWRVPFLFGGSACIVGFFIRKYVLTDLNDQKMQSTNLINFFKAKEIKLILESILILLMPCFLMVHNLHVFITMKNALHYEPSKIHLASITSVILSIVIAPLLGKRLELIRKNLIAISFIYCILYFLIYLNLAATSSTKNLYIFFFAHQLVLSTYYVNAVSKVAERSLVSSYKTMIIALSFNLTMMTCHLIYMELSLIDIPKNYIASLFMLIYGALFTIKYIKNKL